MIGHLSNFRTWKQGKSGFISSFHLFEEYGPENCVCEIISEHDTITKQELTRLEFEQIQQHPFAVNNNKGVYGPSEQIQEYRKHYRALHGKRMNEQTLKTNKIRIVCACGHEHMKGNTFNHHRSKTHQRWEAEQEIMNIQWD